MSSFRRWTCGCLLALAACGPFSTDVGGNAESPQPDGGTAPTDGSTGGQDGGTAQPGDAARPQLLVVHDLHAGGLSASVVYAHEIRAKNARYGRLVNVCDCDLPEQGRQDLRETGTIEAQEVHAHEVDVDWLKADIVYAHALKTK